MNNGYLEGACHWECTGFLEGKTIFIHAVAKQVFLRVNTLEMFDT